MQTDQVPSGARYAAIEVAVTLSNSASVDLSIIVVAPGVVRGFERTLFSLSADYQRGASADDYEVIVVDNGSSPPVDAALFVGLEGNFRLLRIESRASLAHALNAGLQHARGESLGVIVDETSLVSPGLVRFARAGQRIGGRSAVLTLAWQLGYDLQTYALQSGWTGADEDELLRSIDWPNDGYRMFEGATMDESSINGWFEPLHQGGALFLPATVWKELDGFDERFKMGAADGSLHHDVLRRAARLAELDWVILLGEGTFRQVRDENTAKHSAPAKVPRHEATPIEIRNPVFIGTLPPGLRARYAYALNTLLHRDGLIAAPVVPPVSLPDPARESNPVAARWMERATFAARDGQPVEAATFARWGRVAASNVGSAGPLLACVATDASVDDLPPAAFARFHSVAGLVCLRGAGTVDAAAAHFAEALRVEPGNADALHGLAIINMPGPGYHEVLRWLHDELRPSTYLEIGVANGGSLALARPPTVAFGVDPAPAISSPTAVEFHIYPETSSEFFTRRDVRALLGGAPSLVFIDGLHQFPVVLEDFWQVEQISDPDTVVVLHDMIPLSEITQRPEQVYDFYTGDVWKLLHVLADVRSDLSSVTVRTQPSGLTLITGLDPTSTVLRDRYDEWVERYDSLTFEDAERFQGARIDSRRDAVVEWLNNRQAIGRRG